MGVLTFSALSGTWTACGNGELGSGFCDANPPLPLPKVAFVGVFTSSGIVCGVWGCGAVLGLGVVGDVVILSSALASAGSGEFTGLNAAAMMCIEEPA